MQSALIDEDSTTLQPAKLDFETQENNSIGAMDRYVTVQESGKRLTELALLPLIVLVVTVTVLVPVMYIPPPCKRIDAFRSFTALHWGNGLLRDGSTILGMQLT
jgi:hypothetical protein